MPKVLLGVGSNLGDRKAILDEAVAALRHVLDVTAVSKWFTYPAVGGPVGQEAFLNGAIAAETDTPADELRQQLQAIEQNAGRERVVRWSSRTLDCDLLLYGDRVVDTRDLQVPHPRMITRRFVLEPANEVARDMVHPLVGWSIGQLYRHLQTASPYYCVLGSDHHAAGLLAQQLAEVTGCRFVSGLEPNSGTTASSALAWGERVNALLPATPPIGDTGWVGRSWCWEPWLRNSKLAAPADFCPRIEPKLIIVLDPLSSKYGQQFTRLLPQLRQPTLFLSQDPTHALQDAVGAVWSMRM